MFKGKRKSFQAFHKFRGEEVSNLGVQSGAPTWKQLGFMYLVLLFKLEGLLTFYFYRAQKKRVREPFAHRVPKKTPAPPSEGLCLRPGGEGTPRLLAHPSERAPALLPAGAGLAGPAADELGQDEVRPERVCEWGPGRTVLGLGLRSGRNKMETFQKQDEAQPPAEAS